jgi:hypothetical protein
LRSSGNRARPYIWRLIILIRLMVPSTTPELQGRVSPLRTASRGLPAWRKSLFRSLPGVSPGKAKGLLVGRRLSNPAALPGVRRVIVTGQRMFVMPAWGQLRGAAAAPGRRDRGAGRARRGPSVPAGARPRRSCCLPAVRPFFRPGAQHRRPAAGRRRDRRAAGADPARGAPLLLRQPGMPCRHVRRAGRRPDLPAHPAHPAAEEGADRGRAGPGRPGRVTAGRRAGHGRRADWHAAPGHGAARSRPRDGDGARGG